jgi:hypothetical protein
LSLGFESHFFPTITLGDGVCSQMRFPRRSFQRHFTVDVNVFHRRCSWCELITDYPGT